MRKNRRNGIKHILAMILFCMVMSIGMVCLADEQGTVTVKSAKIRASADINSEPLGSVAQGKKVDIIGKATGTDGKVWYQVYVDANTKGFIRGDLLDVPNAANIKTVDGSASAQPAESTVMSVESRQVMVINDNSNIRQDASTSSEPVATVNNGKILTVIGETGGADGDKWYQVSFNYNDTEVTGYVRSDVVSDSVPADLEPSEADGNADPGEGDLADTAPGGESSSGQSGGNVIPLNVDEVPYIMPGFELVLLTSDSGDQYNAYYNGDFYIFYAQRPNGEEGWVLFDSVNHVYQRYVYTADGSEAPDSFGSVGLIPIIVLVVIIIILVAVVGLLLLKLREHGASYRVYGDDDDDDYQDDEIEDLEELEEDEKPQPIRRPQGAATQQPARRPQERVVQQPSRRPQGNPQSGPSGNGAPQERVIQQPARRPQGSPQPARRPQGNPQNPQSGSSGNGAPQGGTAPQPIRRPQGGNPAHGAARTQQPLPRHPQTNTGQLPLRPAQPQQQNDKAQMQKGYKAKNLLDEDMDFMDIE